MTGGQFLGDFELMRELGRGGMGVVYEARQVTLDRHVALKVLPPGLGLTPQAVQRFEREARAAAKLHHTNIVPVHAIGEEAGTHYYAMELVEGQSLAQVLDDLRGEGSNPLLEATVTRRAGEMPPAAPSPSQPATTSSSGLTDTATSGRAWFDTVARLVAEVADALDYAHGRGVIHRDIKPANLLMSRDGRLCVSDFGLARVAQEPGMTVSGSFLGTPAYMSPEQVAAGRMGLDHRTDVYSLGAVLYELLTLQRPFPGESREEILSGILTRDPRSPRRINPRVPLDLETICLKAMEKAPERRYGSAGELAADLRQYLQRGLIAARRAGPLRRAAKLVRRHPVAATALAASLVVLVAGALTWRAFTGQRQSEVQRLVSEARLLLHEGSDREALARANEAAAAAPEDPNALLVRARARLQVNHHQDAVEDARRVLAADAESWEAHLIIAVAVKQGGLYSVPVEKHVEAVQTRTPDGADAFYLMGMLASHVPEQGAWREAIAWYNRALEADPGHAWALKGRSDAYFMLRDVPAARADAERLIAVRPRSSAARRQRGRIHENLHDYVSALAAYEEAFVLDSEDPGNYLARASLHGRQGQTADQIADLTRAIEIDPRNGSAYDMRAGAHYGRAEYDQAIADARRALEINPDSFWAYQTIIYSHWLAGREKEARAVFEEQSARAATWDDDRGVANLRVNAAWYHMLRGEYETALTEANRAIELYPGNFAVYRIRATIRQALEGASGIEEDCGLIEAIEVEGGAGDFHARAGIMGSFCHRIDQALADYARAIELAPEWAEPYHGRGRLLGLQKRYEEALADLTRATELAPRWTNPLHERGQVYQDLERHEEALADFERAVELGDERPWVLKDQAWTLIHLGREKEAFRVFEETVSARPEDATALTSLADALFLLGRVEEALERLDRAVEVQPGSAWARIKRAWVAHFRPGNCEQIRSDIARADGAWEGPGIWHREARLKSWFGQKSCPGVFDPEGAVKLARRAVESFGRNSDFLLTLGVSLYRAGALEEASEVLEESLERSPHESPISRFFLAMTSWERGQPDKARVEYRRGLVRMESTFPKNPEYLFARDEAARLIGIEP